MSHPHTYTLQFSGPGTYRIRVLGNLCGDMLDHFEGVVDSVEDIGEGKVSTSIIVNVQDQAQLCGIINILYDHRLVLISVIWDHLLLERKSGAITKSLLKGTQDVFFQKLGTSLNAKTN